MSDTITIYGHPVSPFVRKALIAMELKGLKPSEIIPITPFLTPEALDGVNPLRRIPVFVQGELTLPDSTIIAEYLDDAFDGDRLYPSDPVLRAKARWFEEYADTHIAVHFVLNYFFEKLLKGPLLKQDMDEEKVAHVETKMMPEILDYLEDNLSGDGFLLGDTPYMPDFAIGFFLQNAMFAGWQVDEEKWPKVASFLSSLMQHSAYAKVAKFGMDMLAARGDAAKEVLSSYMAS